ncbi:hypothetical protein EJ05DRAFT_536307 [Pseudovirgaria hyperparasitica]|uniref:Tetratricopeptide SHNi-TPR domain-containing protein n=1 Tax=Pseudovirgaria hyperparasitica TaxID=470096 RepID=A0A6A6WG64_9PEZI|nr:uncharacterized protein EJ05DRAFT_536307 [Pseudovirgaria hyperparasitica]KAF2760131.1 hypothetical protein EJ05DRAFT_536307 [Pseudovirgaria hyperparasitica]
MDDNETPTLAAIAKLTENANLQYSLKNYDAAAELYSRATEMQDELHGEMAPESADLLFLYGRCLYKVGVSKSDVLGGKVASEEKSKKKGKTSNGEGSSSAVSKSNAISNAGDQNAEAVLEAAVETKDSTKPADQSKAADKPYFSITGDENWDTDSDDEDAGEEGDAAEDEDDDDFKIAYEILDTARVILQHKLENHTGQSNIKSDKGKDKAHELYPGDVSDPVVRATKEKLAEILDLQADISLESERFEDAVPDNQAILALRKDLLPPEHAFIAESYYKLSLALEFASLTYHEGEGEPPSVDEGMRKDAAKAMEDAIASCHLRIKTESEKLSSLSAEDKVKKELEIKDVKELIAEMEERLVDLKASPLEVPNLAGPAGAADANPLGGILSSILGETPGQQKARIEEAVKGANDLSGMVKKKKPAPSAAAGPSTDTNGKGKRKLEDGDDSDTSKKAKVEDA